MPRLRNAAIPKGDTVNRASIWVGIGELADERRAGRARLFSQLQAYLGREGIGKALEYQASATFVSLCLILSSAARARREREGVEGTIATL